MTERVGVLVLSHGTPASRDGIGPFYTAIRHGRPPPSELLDDLVRRYDAIGGTSPLNQRTAAQVAGVARALSSHDPQHYVVESGTKYATPSIEEAADRLGAAGVAGVVGIVLSPLYAPLSVDQYHDRARAALGGTRYVGVDRWFDDEDFVRLLADRVTAALEGLGREALVLFTAHSLPVRVAVTEDADYPGELARCAGLVATAASLTRHRTCFQSAGRTADPWVGPDLLEVLRDLDPDEVRDVVVCPVGFVSDHLEVLYDVDVEAASLAASRGILLRRTASLNDDPAFCAIVARVVEARARR